MSPSSPADLTLYRSLYNEAPVGYVLVDGQGVIARINQAGARLLDQPINQLIGMRLGLFATPSDRPGLTRLLKAAFSSREPQQGAFTLAVKGRGSLFIQVDAAVAPGETLGRIVMTDITARKVAESRLQEIRDRLQATLGALPDILFVLDREGRIYDFHAPHPELLYVSPEQFLGRKMGEILPEPAAGILNRAIEETIAHGHHHGSIYPLFTPAGERWFELSLAAQGDVDTPEGRLVAIARDITERKETEEALQASEAKYRRLHENMRDAFVSMDLQGHLLETNGAFQSLTGYSDEELADMTSDELTPARWHPREAQILAQQILARGYSEVYQKEFVHKDGSHVPVELRTILIRDEHEKPAGMWSIVRDISDRKRIETALQRANSELKAQIEAHMAHHEFPQPEKAKARPRPAKPHRKKTST